MDPIELIRDGKITRYFRATRKLNAPNMVSHITQRAAGKEPLFLEDGDYLAMLGFLKEIANNCMLRIYAFCLMPNHYHILVRMFPEHKFTDEDIKKRYVTFYGDDKAFPDGWIPSLREKLSNLSEFVREIKVGFTRYYNKGHNRRGYFWGDRFKSVIVKNGETLINCLAYIDLNPLRAGIVERPEDYRWN